jgi:hypothetical protein
MVTRPSLEAKCSVRSLVASSAPLGRAAAVGEDGPHPGVLERLDGGVGVLGGAQVVRPVHEGRDAGVERLEAAEVVARVGVLGAEVLAEAHVQARHVLVERPVGGDVAHDRLPGVAVGVDESGHHDGSGGVDDLGAGRLEAAADLGDAAVADEDVGVGEGGVGGDAGEDGASGDQDVSRVGHVRAPCLGWVRGSWGGGMGRQARSR